MSVEKLPNLISSESYIPFLLITNMAPEQITKSVLLSRVRNAQLRAGDTVIVRCMSHHGDELLAESEWRVIARKESIETRDLDSFQTRQDMAIAYEIAQVGDWWLPRQDGASGGSPPVKWNPGRKMHQVLDGEAVVFESADKDEATRYAAKHAAHAA